MASVHHFLNETHVAWKQSLYSRRQDIAVTEIWRSNDEESQATDPVHRRISRQDVSGWSQQTLGTRSRGAPTTGSRCVLRTVWILQDTQQRIIDVDGILFEEVCAAFGHQLAQTYCTTQYAGIGSTINETGQKVYYLCQYPKLAVTWSHDAEAGTTSVLFVADRLKLKTLQAMIESKFVQSLAHHKMTPALMAVLMRSNEMDIKAIAAKNLVREVEVRTGYHEWTQRAEVSARGKLIDLAARMSGCGIRTESNTQKLGVIVEFNSFIQKCLEEEKNDTTSKDELLALNRIIQQRTTMQVLDLRAIAFRIRTQKEAVSDTNHSKVTALHLKKCTKSIYSYSVLSPQTTPQQPKPSPRSPAKSLGPPKAMHEA